MKKTDSDSKNAFAGFGDWVEIFKGGKQTDSAGNTHDGNALIDKAVSTFNPSYHEPPAVLGHPADNAPAYGWVSELKAGARDGVKTLYAKFRGIVPEFEDMVKAERFKKRSASFYPDGRLRHVGWLGAMPPAVKGLADVAFSEDDQAIDFEFNEAQTPIEKEHKMKITEFMEALMFWKKIQENPDAEIGDIDAPGNPRHNSRPWLDVEGHAREKSFTEADLEAAKADAEKAVRAEFAEAETKRKKTATADKIKAMIEAGTKAGTIAPAWKNAGLAEFMEALDGETAIEFGEAKDKKTGLDWFTEFLESLPKLVNFSEIATRDKDVKAGNAAAKLDSLVAAKRKENQKLSYSAAFVEVQLEHPDLTMEYQQEMVP